MKLDGTQERGSFQPIPDGDYVLTVTKVEDGKARSGKDKTTLELTIDDGQYARRKIWHSLTWIPVGEKGHGIAIHALHAFGLDHDGDVDFDTQDFLGRSAKANVVTEEYEGKSNNKIGYFYTEDNASQAAPKNGSAKDQTKAKNGKVEDSIPF